MPIRRTVTIANADSEFTKPGDMAFFDDDKRLLGRGFASSDRLRLVGRSALADAPH